MQLFDSHCHIQDARLAGQADSIIEGALAAGVQKAVCCGSSETDWAAVRDICAAHPGLIPAFGLHPWYVHERSPAWLENLEKFLASSPAAGIGEIGLDLTVKNSSSEQSEVFIAQVELAARLGRPASIHCRNAWEPLAKAMDSLSRISRAFVIHSYSGSVEMITPLQESGAFFSFSGSITRHNNKKGRKAAAAVPLDRLLIETDSPDIPPVIPGKTITVNEPANLIYVLREIAAIRNMPEKEVAAHTWNNACQLFIRGPNV